jgi:2-polyprenyl-6-methoxyphenol hydroxylase-like FAD-dependent oxidoreductase
MSFHRAEFHGALLNRLPSSCGAFSSKRLESYTQQPGGAIMLRFQDGSTATCDILLGADRTSAGSSATGHSSPPRDYQAFPLNIGHFPRECR